MYPGHIEFLQFDAIFPVHFDSQRDATAAKDALNNARVKDRNIRVQVSNTGVRQKAGMGDSDGCFGCGERGKQGRHQKYFPVKIGQIFKVMTKSRIEGAGSCLV